jgi:hypothetical protein
MNTNISEGNEVTTDLETVYSEHLSILSVYVTTKASVPLCLSLLNALRGYSQQRKYLKSYIA